MCSCQDEVLELNPDRFKAKAELLKIQLRVEKIEFTCNTDGLKEVEKFILNRSYQRDEYILKAGALLGECMIETYGGEWLLKDGNWAVKVNEGLLAFPFGKVAKFYDDPEMESLASLYSVIPSMLQSLENGELSE